MSTVRMIASDFESTASEGAVPKVGTEESSPSLWSNMGRREALTGAVLSTAFVVQELERMNLPKSLTSGVATLPDAVLRGDSIVRNLWLNRLSYPILLVALESGLFENLRRGPLSRDELGSRMTPKIQGEGRAMQAIVAVLSSLGLLSIDDERVALTEESRHVLLEESPFFWGSQLLAADGLTSSLRLALHRDDKKKVKSYEAKSDAAVVSFIDSMQAHSAVTAEAVPKALAPIIGPTAPLPAHHVLDMAGGSGSFALAINRQLGLKVTLTDIPVVVQYFRERNPLSRVHAVPADLFDPNSWPTDPDLHLLSNILHDWGPVSVLQILKASYSALSFGSTKNGRLVIVEQLLNDNGSGPLPAALASVSMLLGDWRTGKQYSFEELKMFCLEAGFTGVERGPSIGNFHTAVIAYV